MYPYHGGTAGKGENESFLAYYGSTIPRDIPRNIAIGGDWTKLIPTFPRIVMVENKRCDYCGCDSEPDARGTCKHCGAPL